MSTKRLSGKQTQVRRQSNGQFRFWQLSLAALATLCALPAAAAITCARTLTADVVAIDQPLMFNRLGASNVNGMMYALRRDVIDKASGKLLTEGGTATAGNVELRPDKRPRPFTLRIAAGDCLTVELENLLASGANPNNIMPNAVPAFPVFVDEQPADRYVSFQANGMQYVDPDVSNPPKLKSDGAKVGKNEGAGLIGVGEKATYHLYGEKEGVYLIQSYGATLGSDGNQGQVGNGLFGQLIVEPKDARIYRSMVTEEELRLTFRRNDNGTLKKTDQGQPIINYEARYPMAEPWITEGHAGKPVLNTIDGTTIVHSDMDAIVAGPNADGSFPSDTYPLEGATYRNPTVPNRLEPFRDFSSAFHDEVSTAQAFPKWYDDAQMGYVLAAVGDKFMINYGSGGIGSEIIANRLKVGPMHDCLGCAFEEFFLTSFTVGDPAMIVDVPANFNLENCAPDLSGCEATGPKATFALYPADPANIHHSYIGDFAKFRNTHVGKEQHVFHLHNHQWLFNPNDDNSNYLDAQGIGPGVGYTYEINFGGSGNRNKSAGDSIYHCHFYPHFAMGMWYHWRHHDVLELGTRLAASGGGGSDPNTYHTTPFGLRDGIPHETARALPDGEILVGTPIPAIVPLPGKAMAPTPAKVTVVANSTRFSVGPNANMPVGSVAKIEREGAEGMKGGDNTIGTADDRNPGYPFWIAGIEETVGQRPPTPVLDMLSKEKATELKENGGWLWQDLEPAQADGFDGGLPRHALKGYAAGGHSEMEISTTDFSKVVTKADVVFFKEEGEDYEKAAMAFHKVRRHASTAVPLDDGTPVAADFITNGIGPVVGAPYHEPCVDDTGRHLTDNVVGYFFSGEPGSASLSVGAAGNDTKNPTTGKIPGKLTRGASLFNATNPRVYKAANIQFDAILNKTGYHYPQQRIIALWQDVVPVVTKEQPPEPLVMRLNTFDCAVYSHTNLVPEVYEMDDYQIRTPTDIIGQHIHLPKWDLTTTDGSGNGWNYEDGTLSPGAVRERIDAINCFNGYEGPHCNAALVGTPNGKPKLEAKPHPYFGKFGREDWIGARTTMQRWFADPVVNTDGIDRGLGLIFTHDHYGPSTHQQIGLYATVLTEPAGSKWVHNETGDRLGYDPATGDPGRVDTLMDGTTEFSDGGPTSWQAAVLPQDQTGAYAGNNVMAQPCLDGTKDMVDCLSDFREFYMEFADFQHAYEKGVYVGAGPDGRPLPGNTPFERFTGVANISEAFRFAINPPLRDQISQAELFPDLVIEKVDDGKDLRFSRCLVRPCPQAISAEDPGLLVVNYRAEPVALRVFDPNKMGPDNRQGAQADGIAGDLAFALSTQLTDKFGNVTPITRAIPELNMTEQQLGFWGKTLNAPTATLGGDPFTPMLRAYAGDMIRFKIQAGAHEEEHNASIPGLKWLQAGSANGRAQNSGWRNSQAAGISEQFTLRMPLLSPVGTPGGGILEARDYVYVIDAATDGWWSGDWGLLRVYNSERADLWKLPNNQNVKPDRVLNKDQFDRVCPVAAPVRNYEVIAILANDLLPKPTGVTIVPSTTNLSEQHNGAALNPKGGTLLYNSRNTVIPEVIVPAHDGGGAFMTGGHNGPIHDPTAMLYVRMSDVEVDTLRGGNPNKGACKDPKNLDRGVGIPGLANATCPIKLKNGQKVEPLVLRAAAGECVKVTLYNRLPEVAPDLPTYTLLQGVAKRDRYRPEGSVPFDNNLIRPSTHVALAPQLVAVDVLDQLGLNAGVNVTQTVEPVVGGKTSKATYQWYAGDLRVSSTEQNGVNLSWTPIEFGGVSLSPADRVKQGQKSLYGALSVVPQNVKFVEDAGQHAQATLCDPGMTDVDCAAQPAGTKRDLMLVMAKALNHRYGDGAPVEAVHGNPAIPEDSQEDAAMALNYGVEPLWFRFNLPPNLPFGNAGTPDSFGSIANAHMAYSNELTGGADPRTPVFTAKAGRETRMHLVMPHGTTRGSTFNLHGHVWQRDPYICPGEARNTLTGACNMDGVGSRAIGVNPQGLAMGAQDNITPLSHYTLFLPSAGGGNGVTGDYLFRDQGAFGNTGGLWGILRVTQ